MDQERELELLRKLEALVAERERLAELIRGISKKAADTLKAAPGAQGMYNFISEVTHLAADNLR